MKRRAAKSPLLLVLGLSLFATSCSVVDRLEPDVAQSWNQTHSVDVPSGWTVTGRNVGPTEESTSLSGPDSKGCLVSRWSDKPRYLWPQSPRAVQVQGHEATYGVLDPTFVLYPRGVMWREADDRWLGVSCDLDRVGILRIAQGVRTGENRMPVPFELASVPDGLTMVQLIESTRNDLHRMTAQFEMSGPAGGLVMEISNQPDSSMMQGPVERRTIDGHMVEIRTATQSICFVTESDPVCISGPGDEPASDWLPEARTMALRTAEVLTPIEDPSDEASWLDADDAFP